MSQPQAELVAFSNMAVEAIKWYSKTLIKLLQEKSRRSYIELPVAIRIVNQFAGEKVPQTVCLHNEVIFRNVGGATTTITDVKQAIITATLMPTIHGVTRLGVNLGDTSCCIQTNESYSAYVDRLLTVIDARIKSAVNPNENTTIS